MGSFISNVVTMMYNIYVMKDALELADMCFIQRLAEHELRLEVQTWCNRWIPCLRIA